MRSCALALVPWPAHLGDDEVGQLGVGEVYLAAAHLGPAHRRGGVDAALQRGQAEGAAAGRQRPAISSG